MALCECPLNSASQTSTVDGNDDERGTNVDDVNGPGDDEQEDGVQLTEKGLELQINGSLKHVGNVKKKPC